MRDALEQYMAEYGGKPIMNLHQQALLFIAQCLAALLGLYPAPNRAQGERLLSLLEGPYRTWASATDAILIRLCLALSNQAGSSGAGVPLSALSLSEKTLRAFEQAGLTTVEAALSNPGAVGKTHRTALASALTDWLLSPKDGQQVKEDGQGEPAKEG